MKKLLLTPLFAVLILSGCVFCTQGSGNIISETREVDAFHSVDLSGQGNLYITQGSEHELRIETDDNILKELETEVRNGTLVIKPKGGINCLDPTDSIDIYVTMEEIRDLSVSGSGEIIGKTPIETDHLDVGISGSGDLNLDVEAETTSIHISGSGELDLGVGVDELSIDISGSGKANLYGEATQHNLRISGSGELNAFDLETEDSNINISGSGDANVWVTKNLEINVSGSGDIRYKGNPETVKQNISGSGSVEKVAAQEDIEAGSAEVDPI